MQFFEMRIFFGKQLKVVKKKNHIYSEIIGHTHLFPLHNEPSPMPVG